MALALALDGWPLLTSPRALERSRGGDLGGSDLLAWKIALSEWVARRHGFDVCTPAIPGLPYDAIHRELDAER